MADEALDNLGRKIDTTNMSIGELKGLIASLMKSKVGAAKPVGKAKDDPSKKLVTLFEKYTKGFEDETKEQKKLLQKIADGIKETKSKKKETKEKTGSFTEKANKTLNKNSSKEDKETAKSTRSLAQIFGKKGSGYTHDIYCERYLKEIYGILVDIAKTKGISKLSPEEIEKEVKTAGETKSTVSDFSSSRREKSSYDNEWKMDYQADREIANLEYDYRINSYRTAYKWMESIFSGKEQELMQEEKLAQYSISSLRRMEEFAHLSVEEIKNKKIAVRLNQHNNKILEESLESLKKTTDAVQEMVFGFNVFGSIFSGILKEEIKFTQDIRQAAYEISGITKESSKLQQTYEAIGKTVKATGFDRSDYQKNYIKNLKSGIKDQKKAMTLTTTQLNTEKQIGLEAGALGDTFVKLNNQLGFTDDQTAQVGRGIREVGRNTGLVGQELAEVVNSSQKFVDQMRKAGTATASGVTNVMGLQAEFKKLGVQDAADGILSALSSTTGFYEANIQTQSLIANAASRAGLSFEMTTGEIMNSKENLKGFNKGLIQTANSMGLGGSNAEEMRKNFESLSADAKRSINLRFKSAFGMEAGQALGVIKGFEDSSKSLSEKLSALNQEKEKNLTLEERATLEEKERSLKLSAGMGALTALSEAAKDVANMDEALGKFGKRRSEFEGDIKALGGAWSSETDAARTAIKSSVDSLNKGLKKAGKKGLSIDSAKIEKALKDPATLRELTAEITKGEQELATAQKAQTDPLTSMDQTLKEINDGIRNMSQGIISGIFNSPLGRALIMLSAVLGFLTTGFLALRSSFVNFTEFARTIQNLFNKRGQDLQPGASKVLDELTNDIINKTNNLGDALKKNITEGIENIGEKGASLFTRAADGVDYFYSAFSKGFSRSIIAGEGFFASLKRGFVGAMKSTENTRNILKMFNEGLNALKDVGPKYFKSVVNTGKTLKQKFGAIVASLVDGSIWNKVKNGIGLFRKALSGGLSGVLRGTGTAFKVGMKGLSKGLRASLAGGTLGLSQIVFAGIDAVFGAVSGFQKTGERFGGVLNAMNRGLSATDKGFQELTWGMYASSTISGGLVGILDGLTLGLLRMTGVADFLEQSLSFILYSILSIVEGIVNGILVAFDMVKPALKYLYDQFDSIGSAILSIFSSISSLFGGGEINSASEAFAMLYKILKPIGFLIGAIVGVPLGAVLWALAKTISLIMVPIQMVINAIAGFINVLVGFFKFFKDIFTVGIVQTFKNLGNTMLGAIYGVFKPVVDFVWSLASDITYPFRWLYNVLVGNSIIPDLVTDIIYWFATLPIKIFKALLNIPAMIGKIFSNIGSYLQSFSANNIFGYILKQLGTFYNFIGSTITNFVNMGKSLLKIIQGILTFDFGMIWEGIKGIGSAIVSQLANVGSFILSWFTNFGTYLKSALIDFPIWLGSMLVSGLKSIFIDLPIWLGGLIISGLKSIFIDLPIWLGKTILDGLASIVTGIPGAIYSALYAAASALGMGWLVEGIAGGGGKKSTGSAESEAGWKKEFEVYDMVAPIFDPILSMFEPLKIAANELYTAFSDLGSVFYEIYNVIYETVSGLFSSIYEAVSGLFSVFEPITSMFYSVEDSVGKTFGIMDLFKNTIWGLSKIIGFTLKIALFPLSLIIKSLAHTISNVAKIVKGFADILIGIFTLDTSKIWQGLSSIGSVLYNSIKSSLVDFPIWLGSMLVSGLKSIFIDLPIWLGGLIISGLKSIFIDLPIWLGKTILDGLASIVTGIPGAIYSALYAAASALGMGWLVEGIAGGKSSGGVKSSAPSETFEDKLQKTTSEKAISQINEAKLINTARDSRVLTDFASTAQTKGSVINPLSEENSGYVSSISPMGPGAYSIDSIQTRIQKDKAANSISKSEVTSPELNDIISQNDEQNQILLEMKALFEKFVELAKPEADVVRGSVAGEVEPGGLPLTQKPTNYYRRVFGNMSNTPGRSIVNLGAKSIS